MACKSGYDKYVENIKRVFHPDSPPENLAVSYAAMLGRPIKNAVVDNSDDGCLRIKFEGGGTLEVRDDGRSCCESRYMSTDDDLSSFVGAKVVSLEAVEGPDIPCEGESYGEVHETMFVKLETTMGTITLVTHNEHNGYYGGFDVETEWED